MAIQTVFSNNLNPTTGSLTTRFKRASGFYIDAPLITSEIEIDVFLQVYFPTVTTEKVRNLPLGKLKDGEIKLNETDSESLVAIPNEFVDSDLEMALFFLGSSTTFLEVYVVGANCTLCQINDRIISLEQKVDGGFNSIGSTLAQMQGTLNQILALVGADIVIPGSVPTPIQQEFFFLQ